MTEAADRVAQLQAAGLKASDDGHPALAVRRLRTALRVLDSAPQHRETRGRVLVSLAWAESERGHVELAFRLLDEAELLMPLQRRPVVHAQRAVLLNRNGRVDLALTEFDLAIAGLTERDDPLDLAKALNNRSVLHRGDGRIGAAREDLRRSLGIAVRHNMELGSALIRFNLGCLDVVAGDLPRALRAFAVARTDYERIAPGRLPNIAIEKGRALVAAGLFHEADAELASAVAQARELRQNHVHADALRVRAEVALLSGRPGPAAEWAHEAHAEFLSRRNPRLAALTALLALRAEYAAQDRPSDGLADRARRLAGRLRRLGLAEDARVAALVAARCLLRRTEPETARADEDPRRSSAAARLVRRYGHPRRIDRLDTRLLWRLTQAEIAATAGRPAEASRHLVAGMDALHRYRARFGCLDLQTGASAHGQDLARSGLRAALDRGSVPAIYRWSERARAQAMLLPPVRPPDDPAAAAVLEELRQSRHAMREAELAGRPAGDLRSRVERLQGMIREQSWSTPGVEHVGTSAPAPLGRVRAELGDACLVAYLPDGPGLRALVVTRSGSSVEPLGDRRVAEESLIRLRADLDTQAGRAMPRRLAEAVAAATRRDGADLAATIFDPLRRLIGDRELIVVPTGLLMTTPWALLPGCLERPVTVAPSATAWLAAVHRRRAQERTSDGTALVAGPGNRRGEEEVRAIAELRPQATVLTGAEATPAATLAALDGRSVAHVAAHGWHQSENALFSALELASGPVLGYDLQRLAMPPAMVVLSCCELGLSDVRPGDESLGMASALLAAGTATVVASVSRVADEAAMELMVRYHRDIAAGRSAAAALAAARPAELAAGFVCLGAG